MVKITYWDKIVATASWLIVLFLMWSAVGLWISPPTGAGPVAQALGVFGAQLFYTVLYGAEAALLTWAKLTGRMALRKATLLAVFFTGAFTFGLTISIVGFSVQMLDNMALFALAGICWLYWKFKTEYMTSEEAKEYFKF